MSDQTIKMDKPAIAGTEPVCVSVVPDKNYAWCTCGLSQKQPFCDSAHKHIEGMPYRSLKVKFDAPEEALFCMCKQTKTPPFCDNSHKGCHPG
jgi:CDGSH iron-sulfur domain-containing protein 3